MEHLKKIKPTHLSLFSGIGGLDLAAEWAGFETVGQCEMADFPTKILEKHWPYVQRWRDIRTLTKENFIERTGLQTVDIISGGFPCQPFSVAGKQKGREDDRYLWPDMRRVIAEFAPRWVVGENVPGILRIAAADVIADLEGMGFHVLLLDFEAASVGAPHHRERIAFVANRDTEGLQRGKQHGAHAEAQQTPTAATERSETICRTTGKRFSIGSVRKMGGPEKVKKSKRSMRWPAEPDVGRVAHGVPHRGSNRGLGAQILLETIKNKKKGRFGAGKWQAQTKKPVI